MLRSATAPDPEQDQGHHEFSFAIMPHQGRLLESGVYKQALQYINEVSIRTVPTGTSASDINSPFQITGTDSVILDTVKRGEDDDESGRSSVVIRMFECLGGRTKGSLKMSVPSHSSRVLLCHVTVTDRFSAGGIAPKSLTWVNILEEPMTDEGDVVWQQDGETATVELDFRGFEVRTLLIVL